MQIQQKIDGNQNMDFSIYQKQLSLMTQNIQQKVSNGTNMMMHPVHDGYELQKITFFFFFGTFISLCQKLNVFFYF